MKQSNLERLVMDKSLRKFCVRKFLDRMYEVGEKLIDDDIDIKMKWGPGELIHITIHIVDEVIAMLAEGKTNVNDPKVQEQLNKIVEQAIKGDLH